jgi:hypothetical protein
MVVVAVTVPMRVAKATDETVETIAQTHSPIDNFRIALPPEMAGMRASCARQRAAGVCTEEFARTRS